MKSPVDTFYKGIRVQMKNNGHVQSDDVEILLQMIHWITNTAQFCPECSQEGCQTCDANFRGDPHRFEEAAYVKCRVDVLTKRKSAIKFNHSAHVKMWNWLAENPGKRKEDAVKALNLPQATEKAVPTGLAFAYACAYAKARVEGTEKEYICDDCPFSREEGEDEFGKRDDGECLGGLVALWMYCRIDAERGDSEAIALTTKIAKYIASLPVRDGVETI